MLSNNFRPKSDTLHRQGWPHGANFSSQQFFQRIQNIAQNTKKIRFVAMVTNMAPDIVTSFVMHECGHTLYSVRGVGTGPTGPAAAGQMFRQRKKKKKKSQQAALLAAKKSKQYCHVMAYVRCRLSFSLLRSCIMCLRGCRKLFGRPGPWFWRLVLRLLH